MANELTMFLEMMASEHGASSNTLLSYEDDLRQFFEISSVSPSSITSETIQSYVSELGERHYALKSQRRKISVVRRFCKFLLEEKILKDNPLPDITIPKRDKTLPKFLSKNQIEKLFEKSFSHDNVSLRRIGVLVKLIFSSGLRVSEAVSLPLSNINFAKNQILVKGKGSKERVVFIDDDTKKVLDDYVFNDRQFFISKNKDSKYLFPSKRATDGHLSRDTFFKGLKELGSECEMDLRFVFPHALRHSFATNLLDHHVDLRSVQKMLGHENIATTEIYTHIASQKLIDSVIAKHPLQNFEPTKRKD